MLNVISHEGKCKLKYTSTILELLKLTNQVLVKVGSHRVWNPTGGNINCYNHFEKLFGGIHWNYTSMLTHIHMCTKRHIKEITGQLFVIAKN